MMETFRPVLGAAAIFSVGFPAPSIPEITTGKKENFFNQKKQSRKETWREKKMTRSTAGGFLLAPSLPVLLLADPTTLWILIDWFSTTTSLQRDTLVSSTQ